MTRPLSLLIALFVLLLGTTQASAQDRDLDMRLAAALESYRSLPVQLAPEQYAPPQGYDRQSQGMIGKFAPGPGGHTLRQAHVAHVLNARLHNENPRGAKAWIYRLKADRWLEIFEAVRRSVDVSIRMRHDAGDELFAGFYTIKRYDDLCDLGDAARTRLGTLDDHSLARLEALQTEQERAIQQTLRPSHNGFAGAWKTSWTGGSAEMTLAVSGRRVTGRYDHQRGTIQGTLSKDGRTLTGTWKQGRGTRQGKIRFVLTADGRGFTGKWGYGTSTPTQRWDGKRQGR